MRDKRVHSKVIPSTGPADSDESPKSVKRDGKPATERPAIQDSEVSLIRSDSDRGRRRRLQDPLPLEETPHGPDGPVFSQHPSKVSERNPLEPGPNIAPLNPTHVPRSGYYFQHDDRSGPPAGRIKRRRPFDRTGWNEPRVNPRYNERFRETSPGDQVHRREDRRQGASHASIQRKMEDAWSHDKFLEAQAEELDSRKKISTSEKKPLEAGKVSDEILAGADVGSEAKENPSLIKAGNSEEQKDGPDKRPERRYPDMNLARRERERYRERGEELDRGRWMDSDQWNARFQSRGGRFGGRERPGGRSDMLQRNSSNNRVVADRWTHDGFEEINRSPSPKQEDNIAQIEALLSA